MEELRSMFRAAQIILEINQFSFTRLEKRIERKFNFPKNSLSKQTNVLPARDGNSSVERRSIYRSNHHRSTIIQQVAKVVTTHL